MTTGAKAEKSGANPGGEKISLIAKAVKELSEDRSLIQTLEKGDRVELIPIKDGIKTMRVRRKEIK